MSRSASIYGSKQSISSAGWMITFADLLSLMLTFFVLVFSMSTVQLESWDDVVKTMRKQFNPSAPISAKSYEIEELAVVNTGEGLNLNYLRGLLADSVQGSAFFSDTRVFIEDGKVVLSIPAHQLFENKSSFFVSGSVVALRQFAGTFMNVTNKLVIAGHTNDIEMPAESARTNWELSIIRARLVAGVLADAGYTRELTVLGHGASKFEGAGRRVSIPELEQQERIDIVFLAEGRGVGAFDVF